MSPGIAGLFHQKKSCFWLYYVDNGIVIKVKLRLRLKLKCGLPMMNLSTHYYFLNSELRTEEDEEVFSELESAITQGRVPLFKAPKAALDRIMGFASAYLSLPSVHMEEVELMKN